MPKITREQLNQLFEAPRDDHPGRRGGQYPRRGSGTEGRRRLSKIRRTPQRRERYTGVLKASKP